METMVIEMESIERRTRFDSCLVVGCEGNGRERARGITLLWQSNVSLSTIYYSLNHIYCSCVDHEDGEEKKWKWVCPLYMRKPINTRHEQVLTY